MQITSIPIVDYLRYCMNAARSKGFFWVMVLLSRERDNPRGFDDIARYWDSYGDLTGEKILFVMSARNDPQTNYNHHLEHSDCRYKRLGNTSFMIVNETHPPVLRWNYPNETQLKQLEEQAIYNTSSQVSSLLKMYRLSEADVPAILLIPTGGEDPNPIVLRHEMDIYGCIKSFIEYIEPSFRAFDDCQAQLYAKRREKEKLDKELRQCVVSKGVRKYIEAKDYINQAMLEMDSDTRNAVKTAIETKDLSICAKFSQPLRGILNRIIDIQVHSPKIMQGIENAPLIVKKIQQLDKEKKQLEKQINETGKQLNRLRIDTYKSARAFSQQRTYMEEKTMSQVNNKHFKIAFTFSGKYRGSIVEPVCNELLSRGSSKDDIFFDEWHSALINGINGSEKLKSIYFQQSDCVVVLLSPDYKERNWTGNIEWRAVKELINTGKGNRICLLGIDGVDVANIDGLYKYQDLYKRIDNMMPCEIADFLEEYCRENNLYLNK
ncbi:MAG: hypothetical protein Q4E38_03785 [Eubacteriales bacterium]|nr:hypothetical protein [Eubacteriales bacterium]